MMSKQIRHLVWLAQRPHINVYVIPFRHGAYPAGGPFSFYGFRLAPPIVHVGDRHASTFLELGAGTSQYQAAIGALTAKALNFAESAGLMTRIAADHERS
ncbi:hypothetical protein UO65_5867 [Actinokineospora spheciospongiae]|uniref:DUF5753 domain-containing protein n=1 Tax=Actinokineospora spheciospongiae TaxID=909613 RepID=W7IDC2_9PSEU|nr:hypothetical protein UO65_5867 [Actinokineospora spheciospongiae]